jgi:hypothetical protein
MTAAQAQRGVRRPLELVPQPIRDDVDPTEGLVHLDGGDDWRAQTVLNQWDPEHQLIGALMYLPAVQAAAILKLVPDEAIWQPTSRWAIEIIRHLVDHGRDPDPVVVLRTARHQPAADALNPEGPVTAARHHQFAVYLASAYTQTVAPSCAHEYAREVLDDAYRRAISFHGQRLRQLAETGAARAVISGYLATMRSELAGLWRRTEAAHDTQEAP